MKKKKSHPDGRHVRYIFLDVEGFTNPNRRSHHQSEIIAALGTAVKKSLRAQKISFKDEDKVLLLPTGDGICIALFHSADTPTIHLKIAIRILHEVDKFNSEQLDPASKFTVRAGLNSGNDLVITDIRGQKNLAGKGINETQRIMSAGDGGNVIVSQEDYSWLIDSSDHDWEGTGFREIQFRDKHKVKRVAYQFINSRLAWLNNNPPKSQGLIDEEAKAKALYWMGNDMRLFWHFSFVGGDKRKMHEVLGQVEQHRRGAGLEPIAELQSLLQQVLHAIGKDWEDTERASWIAQADSIISIIDATLGDEIRVEKAEFAHVGESTNGRLVEGENPDWEVCSGDHIPSQILRNPDGAVAVWANVTAFHDTEVAHQWRHKYILGHATHDGKRVRSRGVASYPNAWAIARRMPTTKGDKGVWAFWSNGMAASELHLTTEMLLAPGWHLFIVEWSRKADFIRFHIDEKIVANSQFQLWPEGFAQRIVVGNWADKQSHFSFGSSTGPCYLWKAPPRESAIAELLTQMRPEE